MFAAAIRNAFLTTNPTTKSHPEMVGDISRVTLNFDLSKNSFCAFLARVKTYAHTKN